MKAFITALTAVTLVCSANAQTATRTESLVVTPMPRPSATNTQWFTVVSNLGAFAVEMPGRPTEGTNSLTVDAETTLALYDVTAEPTGKIAFSVMYADFPKHLLNSKFPERAARKIREGLARKGDIINEGKVKVQGVSANEWVLINRNLKARITARVFVADQRLYQMIVVVPEEKPSLDAVRHFFESFRFKKR